MRLLFSQKQFDHSQIQGSILIVSSHSIYARPVFITDLNY